MLVLLSLRKGCTETMSDHDDGYRAGHDDGYANRPRIGVAFHGRSLAYVNGYQMGYSAGQATREYGCRYYQDKGGEA